MQIGFSRIHKKKRKFYEDVPYFPSRCPLLSLLKSLSIKYSGDKTVLLFSVIVAGNCKGRDLMELGHIFKEVTSQCVHEEAPAAVALLHMQDQIATLVAAATVPQFRGRGCQTALLQQRIVDAADAGCTLLVTQTRVGTASQRNMERAGMRVAYTSTIWRTFET